MKRLWWRLWMRAHRRLGTPGLLALALLIPVIAVLAALPQWQRQSERAAAELTTQSLAQARRGPIAAPPPTGAEQLRRFVAEFPLLSQSAHDLSAVFAAAKRHDIVLNKGEYQLKTEANTAFVKYTATFPLHHDFAALKDFSAEVLSELPHAAMDEMRLGRDSAGGDALDAVVRFTFFYRTP